MEFILNSPLNMEATRIENFSKAVIADNDEKVPEKSPRRRSRSRSFIVDDDGKVSFSSPRSVLEISPRLGSPPTSPPAAPTKTQSELKTPIKSKPILTPLLITRSALTLNTDAEDSCYSPRSPPRSARSTLTPRDRDRSQDLKFCTPPLSPHTEIARRMNHFRELAARYGSAPTTPRTPVRHGSYPPSFLSPRKEPLSYDLLKQHRSSTALSNEQLVAEFSSLFVKTMNEAVTAPTETIVVKSEQVDGFRVMIPSFGTGDGIVLKAEVNKYQRRRSYD